MQTNIYYLNTEPICNTLPVSTPENRLGAQNTMYAARVSVILLQEGRFSKEQKLFKPSGTKIEMPTTRLMAKLQQINTSLSAVQQKQNAASGTGLS